MQANQYDEKSIKRFNDIQQEILKIGWNGILIKYHPDNNCESLQANDIFKMYKMVYDNMKERLIVA